MLASEGPSSCTPFSKMWRPLDGSKKLPEGGIKRSEGGNMSSECVMMLSEVGIMRCECERMSSEGDEILSEGGIMRCDL